MNNKEEKYISYFDKFLGMEPYLYIDEKEWEYIKKTFPEEDVKYSLAFVAITYPLPYRDISEEDAENSFKSLQSIRWGKCLKNGEWEARESSNSYKYPLTIKSPAQLDFAIGIQPVGQEYITLNSTGNAASDYFHQVNRWTVDASAFCGPKKTWSDMKYMITLMGAAYSLKLTKIDKLNLRLMIAMRKYICSQFKPLVAKCIYDMYKPKTILDFSAGWGDRLAAFYASHEGEFYLGIDPNKNNHDLYKKQAEFYKKFSKGGGFISQITTLGKEKKSEFICMPAEEYDYKGFDGYFDMCFTSPPYFDKERYSHDETQSWKRYRNIDRWNEDFLQCTLNKVWKTLKKDGLLLVNISDVYSFDIRSKKKQWLEICDPMNNFISMLPGAEYVGCLGMQMAKRPNNTAKLNTIFCEPIWIWKKGR